jgi:predicted nucleic acid binding AN1-type Zn finger protein
METGKCKQCARRQRLVMPCKLCTGKFCSGCIQLEIHTCPELDAKKMIEREKLTKSNPVITSQKIVKI